MRRFILFSLILLLKNPISSQCWVQVFADEFSGTSLDLSKWEPQIGGGGWGNNELQYYTARPENIQVGSGSLKIIALDEDYLGSNYTSARLRTKGLADFAFGKMEARLKLPPGQGLWPAFWMLPSETYYGTWPAGGEIDIMEYLGHQTSTSYSTIHAAPPLTSSGTTYVLPSGNFVDDFHLFRAEWEPNVLRFYVDGVLISTKNPASVAPAPWRFDRIFHLLLNLAVGGNWPGPPDANTVFPAIVEADWVRIYQQNSDLAITGEDLVEPGRTGVLYKIPSVGSVYFWTVPAGASIASGQGTSQISVNWGATTGPVSCQITTTCGTTTRSRTVTVSPNLLHNPGFENELHDWITGANSGGAATWQNVSNNNPPGGTSSMCATVTALGPDPWNVQFFQPTPNVLTGQQYTCSMMAKADATNRPVTVTLWRPSASFGQHTFSVGTAWQSYSFNFTPVFAPPAGAMQLNFDIGSQLGEYCFDQISLAQTVLLPLELIDFYALPQKKGVALNWKTASEMGIDRFEIERSEDGFLFEKMGDVPAKNAASGADYLFFDGNTLRHKLLFYRLRMVGNDGEISFSPVIEVETDWWLPVFEAGPNPTDGPFHVEFIEKKGEQMAHLRAFDILGRQIFETDFMIETDLDVRSWLPGFYRLLVEVNGQTEVVKLMKD